MIVFLNIVLDFILLMSVSVILNRNAKIKRILLGSLIGGGSTFLLFVNLSSLLSFIFKIILGIIMCIVTFDYRSIKYSYNNLFYLLTTSFSVGGVMYLLKENKYYNYPILIIGFFVVLLMYIKQLKKFKENYANYYSVDVYIKNNKYHLTGFLDTGNKLYDNYHHRPVILTSKKIKHNLEDIIYVSYVSLNDQRILKCLKVDKIVINKKVYKNYLIGLSSNKFMIDGVDCILHSKMKGDFYA